MIFLIFFTALRANGEHSCDPPSRNATSNRLFAVLSGLTF